MTAKRLLFGIIALLAFCFSSYAQTAPYDPYWQWAKADTFSALNYSGGTSVLGVRNNKVLWGRLTGNQTVVNGRVMGRWTLTEYDTNGVQTNMAIIGGKVELIDVQGDAAGNWYVLGRFWDSAALGNVTLIRNNPATNPDADHFMLRLNTGSFVVGWHKTIGAQRTTSSQAFTIANNNIVIAVDSSDATLVRRMNLSTGNFAPLFKQGGKSTTTSIQVDASGNIYMAGSCADKNALDFNGVQHLITPGTIKGYIVKYNFNNTHAWHHIINDPRCAQRKITLHRDQFLYYTGTLHDSLTLGLINFHPPLQTLDFLAARLDPSSGAVSWSRQIEALSQGSAHLGEAAFHATVTPDTALIVFPQATPYVDWGNNVTTNLFNTYSSVVLSIGADNQARWARTVFAENVTNDRVVAEGNAIWVSGSAFTNTAFTQFDTLNLRMPARRWVPYMAKLKLIRPPFVPNGVANTPSALFSAAPNPARDAIRVSGLSKGSTIVLRDLNGRAIVEQLSHSKETILNVSELPRGTYFLHMHAADGNSVPQVRKMVLQ